MTRNIQTKEDTMARSGSDADARHQLAEAFRGYLTRERGLAQGTVDNYSHGAALFLARLPGPLDEALREMSAGRVLEIIGELVRPGGPSARSLSVPLRALLRFLHVTGRIPRPLAGAVPTEPRWRLASLPAQIDRSAVSALLAGCDRGSERGPRDYAVLVLLSRLGPRGAGATGGMEPAGPHRLRHALAGELLAAGAALGEVAQMLRHQDLRTTAIYAKVDRAALAQLARPWPGTEAGS